MHVRLPEAVDITAEALAAALRDAAAAGELELDATAVRRVDAAGLQLLYAAAVAVRARGGEVRWQAVSHTLHEGARVLGLCAALGLAPEEG